MKPFFLIPACLVLAMTTRAQSTKQSPDTIGVVSLKAVDVKAIRSENIRQMPVSTYSFSREEIFRNPGSQGDIFRAIGILPGVTSAGGQFSAISVRGQGVRDNVYLIDDIPMTQVSHLENSNAFNDPTGGRFSIFAPRIIDNAVFQGGGFGAQYGRESSSYLGLTVKEGNHETPIASGQFDLLGATLIYDGPGYFDKNTTLFAAARYQNFTLLENVAQLKNIGTPAYGDYMLKTVTQLGPKNKLEVIAMYNPETYTKTVKDVAQSDQLEDLTIADSKNDKSLVGLNLRTLTGRNSYWKNVLYFRTLTIDGSFGTAYPSADANGNLIDKSNIPLNPDITNVHDDEHELGYRSVFTRHFSAVSVTAGVDLARVSIGFDQRLNQTDTLYTFAPTDIRPSPSQYYLLLQPSNYNAAFNGAAWNVSAYTDFSIVLWRSLTLNPGVRYDYTGFSREHTVSPRLSGSVPLTGKSSINFATGIYYQDPLLTDVAQQSGGHKLQTERTAQYILGYRDYFSDDLKFVAETWYKKFDHQVGQPYTGQSLLNNAETGYAYGADLNLTKRLTEKFYGQIGYSYMQSKRDDHNTLGTYNFTYSQPNIFSLLGSYKPNSRWVFSAKFRYAAGRPKNAFVIHSNVFNDPGYIRYSAQIIGVNEQRLSNYISLDGRVDYKLQLRKTTFTAFVDIDDLLNRNNQSAETLQPITGKPYYDGLAIFPSFGIRLER
jgi:TonB-dependent Receptor Plug Domain